jgi:hypothetical protein
LSVYLPEEVVEVRDLDHLDRLLASPTACSSVVVVGFHSRSCGVCKEVFRRYAELAAQVRFTHVEHEHARVYEQVGLGTYVERRALHEQLR